MDQIRKQVERARRRLWLELFLARLVKCWFAALAVAAIAIAVPKFMIVENLPTAWAAWCVGGGAVVGLIVALMWMKMSGRSELDAAIEIDRRFDLKERVASSLSLPAEAAATPAGQALLHDAERVVRRLEIDERFRVRVGRSALLPLAPAAVAIALAMFVGNQEAQSSITPASAALSAKALENSTTVLRKRLVEIAKKTPKTGLKEAQALLLELEKQLEKLASKKDVDRKQALMQFNNLAQQLAERREKLGADAEVRRQLAGMKDLGRGPGDKMAAALKGGDWEQARSELQKLQKQLAGGQMSEEAKKQLAEQLKKLESQLGEAAAKRDQAIAELKKQVEEQKQKGDLAKAGELQQKLEKLQQQKKQGQQLQQLAQQMAEASQKMQQGDQQAASESMAQMSQQLEQMQQEMDADAAESEMLDMAMDQLEASQDSLTCENCAGEGCSECEGGSPGDAQTGRSGRGIGSGRAGMGPRQQDDLDTAFRDTQIKQNPGRGPAVITGEADGPTIRGEVREAIKEEVAAAESDEADAMVIEQLPRSQRENAEEYFNRLREGE